ncbi:undecaprenyl-phosphate glucose phosphotransferase [Sandarakinorhabdus oryzae]|uniref:undecaprenyl-phosphate glucose phosphotransferase n=1 Tax=Sandarakinorhabdus oryzae TaxID=2675220 RepID=UPI0012E26F83|nr:undecaprenyl-phosphate glucose phosphotransferase [Sandarakinorhabdus oryzae]
MNSQNPITPPAPDVTAVAGGPGVPLSLAILIVRMLEFLAVGGSGLWLIASAPTDLGFNDELYARITLIASLAFAVLAESLGSYDIEAQFSLRLGWRRVLMAWTMAALFLITMGFLLKSSENVSRAWAISWFATGGVALLFTRVVTTMWVRRLKQRGTFNERVAIFGAGPQGVRFAEYVQAHDRLTITLVGIFDDRRPDRLPTEAAGVPVLGNLSTLIGMIRDGLIDQVVVALPWAAERRLQDVMARLVLTPVKVRLAPDLVSFTFAHRPVVILGDVPVMTLFERPISGLSGIAKTIEDKLLAALILVAVSPIMLLAALAVRLDSSGPILFRQPREGFNNSTFRCFKFRTMYHDQLEYKNINQASRDDPRITRVGRFLRRTSIDELPQLFNVLMGDMSLVGPRPHAASTRAGGRLFSDVVQSYAARHKVKPGITGWAQVRGWRGETDTEEKLIKRIEHDLYYIENWSIWLDLYILVRTVGAVLLPRNAF